MSIFFNSPNTPISDDEISMICIVHVYDKETDSPFSYRGCCFIVHTTNKQVIKLPMIFSENEEICKNIYSSDIKYFETAVFK